ncbi:hypothetical protein ACWGOQ_0002710 [Aquimarina sp. M1]
MKILKEITKIYFFTSLLFIAISCGTQEKPLENPNNLKALAEIKTESKIKDAIITDANVLYVQVEDDGTSRNGYAEYLCQVLLDNKATTNWVRVMKFGSQNDLNKDNAYGVLLGESHCNF